MYMRHACLAAGLALFASGAMATSEGVSVTVRLAAPNALEVSYAMPASCKQLSFLKDGPDGQKIRSRWQAQDGCGGADGDTLVRTGGCPVVRFRVPTTSDKVSGYAGSFPVGQAVYAHTTNYAVGAECGPVQYRFAAAGIATARAAFRGEATTSADAPALLFSSSLAADAKSLDYFDPALSAVAVGQIRTVADGTAAFLRAHMPKAVFKRPIISAALASEPGGPNIGGSAGEILLLSLFNWPAVPAPEHQRLMKKLVAHEMSHPFQMRDAVDDYPDARLIHEGGAEFLRWSVSLRQGWLTPQQAGAELDDALAACMLALGERRWRDVPAREIGAGWLEYSCGLPAYVYALAARQGKGNPYARIDDFYAQLRAGAKPDFAHAMECATALPCKARVLPAIFDAKAPMPAQWAVMLKQTGLATPRAPSQSQTNNMMAQAVTQLVKDDCDGKSSVTPTPDSMLLDTFKECKTLRADVEVLRVEGLPLFGGAQALPAMVAACASRHDVEFGLKDGARLRMPCRVPYRITPQFFAADMKKIAARLAADH
jgi:hypothetical protein